ncbi:MAG: FtsB family cell division protein [Solirubrobacterales bacterium]
MRKARVRRVQRKSNRGKWLVAFAILSAITLGPKLVGMWTMQQEIHALQAKRTLMLADNKSYREEIKALQSEAMVEKLAREELGMIKPDEKVLVTVIPSK